MEMKRIYVESKKDGKAQMKEKLQKITESFYKVGSIGYSAKTYGTQGLQSAPQGMEQGSAHIFSANFLTTSSWICLAFVYTAQSGLNYRKYKKGKIPKKEFHRRMKLSSFTMIGGLAGGSGGAAAGFAVGSLVFPGVGSIVGSVVGGIAGGVFGSKVSGKAYKNLEARIEESSKHKQ